MELKIGKCAICGATQTLIPSNNPLVAPICSGCAAMKIKATDLEDVNLFCRTFNIPFKPELWMQMYSEFKHNVFKEYIKFFYDSEENKFEDTSRDLWKKANEE